MKNPEPRKKRSSFKMEGFEPSALIELPRLHIQPIINFAEVLDIRRSARSFSPVSIELLSELLFLAARVKEHVTDEYGCLQSYRPTASAGALHPIEIFVSSRKLFGDNQLLRYDPFNHMLQFHNLNSDCCDELRSHLSSSFPNSSECAVIWLIAFPDRTSSKYENYSSLVWRDAGALANTLHLTCTFLGLNSCFSGTLGEPFISTLFRDYNVLSAGALLIGGS